MKAIIASEKGGLGADSPALMADRESIMRPAGLLHVWFVLSPAHVQYYASTATQCSHTGMLRGRGPAINRPSPNPDSLGDLGQGT